MIVKDLLSGSKVDAFAKDLVMDFSNQYPVALDLDPARRPSVARVTRLIENLCERAIEFRNNEKLGVLGKAKLGNAFRWALSDLGYRKEFVEMATEALVVSVSTGSVKRTAGTGSA